MTVYRISADEIGISLSDGETAAFFGSYEKIVAMKGEARLALGLLLSEELKKYGFVSRRRLSVELRAVKGLGCGITVKTVHAPKPKPQKNFIIRFSDTEAMLSGITAVYSAVRKSPRSSLYKTENGYALILHDLAEIPVAANGFGSIRPVSETEIAHTEEYGKPICVGNAIGKIGKAFSEKP